MQRSTILFLLLVCAVAAGITAWAWQGPDAPPEHGGNGSPATGDPDRQTPQNPKHEGEVPEGAPHVVLTVTSRETFVPPPAEPSLAQHVDGSDLVTRIVAGVGSGFDADSKRRGICMARVEFEGRELLRQVVVDPEGERRTTIGAALIVQGRVVDERKQPIAGAMVWFGEFAADGTRREFAVDDEGRFECDVPGGEGVPFVVRADGYASTWRSSRVTAPPQPFEAVLAPAAELQLQLATVGKRGARSSAFVMPPANLSTGLAQWPFFLQTLSDGYTFDEQGRCLITDLPADSTVSIVVRQSHAPLHSLEKKLRGRRTQLLVPVRPSPRMRLGMVSDEQGAALTGVNVWSRQPHQRIGGAGSQRLLPPHLAARGTCFTQTDAAGGSFTIGGSEAADLMLSLRRYGHAGRDVPWDYAMEDSIVLPAWRGGDARLRILPPSPAKVWTIETNLGEGVRASVPADESWQVSLPHAGMFDVTVTVMVNGEQREQRTWKQRAVTGAIEIDTPNVP